MSHHKSGDEPVPGYRLINFIGQGSYGEVWNAVGPGEIPVALKFLNLDSKQGLKEFRSLSLVKKLRHVHLVPIHAIYLRDAAGNVLADGPTPEGQSESTRLNLLGSKELVIAMGLGDKSLAQRAEETRDRGGVPINELLRCMEGAAKGIDYLNEPIHPPGGASIIHCDIKPGNLLLVGREVQVCDYGVARALSVDMRKTLGAGTPAYAPPELINNDPSPQTDQYSLAITYFELRTGQLPFDEAKALFANLTGALNLSALSPEEQRVIERATHLQPDRRYPTALEMVEELKIATGASVQRSGVVAAPRERKLPSPSAEQRITSPVIPAPVPAKPKETGSTSWPPSRPLQPSPPTPDRPTAKTDPPGSTGTDDLDTIKPWEYATPPRPRATPPAAGTMQFPPVLGPNKPVAIPTPLPIKSPVDEWSTWKDPIPAPEPTSSTAPPEERPRRGVPVAAVVVGLLVLLGGIGAAIYVATSNKPGPEQAKKEDPLKTVEPTKKDDPPPKTDDVVKKDETPKKVEPVPKKEEPIKNIDDLRAFPVKPPADVSGFLTLVTAVKKNPAVEKQPDELHKALADKLAEFAAAWDDTPFADSLKPLAAEAGKENVLAALDESLKGLPKIDAVRLDQPYSPQDAAKVLRWLTAADVLAGDAGVPITDPKRIEFQYRITLVEWSKKERKQEVVQEERAKASERNGLKDEWPKATARDRARLFLIDAWLSDTPDDKATYYTKAFDLATPGATAEQKDDLSRVEFAAARELWLNPGADEAAARAVTRTVFRFLGQAADLAPAKRPEVADQPGAKPAAVTALRGLVADVWGRKQPADDARVALLDEAFENYRKVAAAADDLPNPARGLVYQRTAAVGYHRFRDKLTPPLKPDVRGAVELGIKDGEQSLKLLPADDPARAGTHAVLYAFHRALYADTANDLSTELKNDEDFKNNKPLAEVLKKDVYKALHRRFADHLTRALDHRTAAAAAFGGPGDPTRDEFYSSFESNLAGDRKENAIMLSWFRAAIDALPDDKDAPKWKAALAKLELAAKRPPMKSP